MQNVYICIDLKSFYASVECNERNLDPLDSNLVVADVSRTEKTICLAVSPSLKAYGIPGRARLFEIIAKVKEINKERKRKNGNRPFVKKSTSAKELSEHPEYELDFIAATPRMSLYIEYSSRIYSTYLKYIAPEDIHVYSIDEVFMDVSAYLNTYKLKSKELAKKMILDVYESTHITATAGIGTNMYLAKVAMDIMAKHVKADSDGVRIAWLTEERYRKMLWSHKPLTDFWRVGNGIARKLETYGMYTMGDVARCSLGSDKDFHNEDLLFKLFGVNAELLIDHAWGYEPCTMAEVKAYKPENNSFGTNQVLHCASTFTEGRLILHEMCDQFALDMVSKGLLTNVMVLMIGFDKESITDDYNGEITTDYYGRSAPKHAHGTVRFDILTSSGRLISQKMDELYCNIVDKKLLIRRIGISAGVISSTDERINPKHYEQLDLFTDYEQKKLDDEKRAIELNKENRAQMAIVELKKKYGKNSVLKGMNLEEGSTQRERNDQIGGHKA